MADEMEGDQPAPVEEDQAAPVEDQAAPVFVIQRETTIKRFHGGDVHHSAESFEEDVRRAWKSNRIRAADDKFDFLWSNVGPSVKTELRCHEVGGDAEKALEKLVEIYGERRSPAQLLQEFYSLHQQKGEPIREYSHRLLTSFEAVQTRCTRLAKPVQDTAILRDHFSSSLQDHVLSKILREKINDEPGVTFKTLRETAIRWTDDVGVATSGAVNAKPDSSKDQEDRIDRLEGLMTSLLTKMDALLTEKQQQQQRPAQPLQQNWYNNPQQQHQRQRHVNPQQLRQQSHQIPSRDKDGRILCYKCGKPGHIQARCPGN